MIVFTPLQSTTLKKVDNWGQRNVNDRCARAPY